MIRKKNGVNNKLQTVIFIFASPSLIKTTQELDKKCGFNSRDTNSDLSFCGLYVQLRGI